jgi:hypothetical protein
MRRIAAPAIGLRLPARRLVTVTDAVAGALVSPRASVAT